MTQTVKENKQQKKRGVKQMRTDPQEIQIKIDAYFTYCDKGKKKTIYNRKTGEYDEVYIPLPYTITGLASFLGCSKQTLYNYSDPSYSDIDYDSEISDSIKKARNKIEANYEERGLTGENNATMTIFTLKNNYGWKDTTELNVGVQVSIEELATKALERRKQKQIEALEEETIDASSL